MQEHFRCWTAHNNGVQTNLDEFQEPELYPKISKGRPMAVLSIG